MAGLYSTTEIFNATPLGASLAAYTSDLTVSLDQLLIEACADVDAYCRRKLAMGPITTLTATTGTNVIDVANCMGIYSQDVVVFASGETQQITGIEPSYALTAETYPGRVYLNGVLGATYASGDPVTVYRQDRYQIRGRETSGLDGALGLSQAGQLAEAHSAVGTRGQNARRIFVREWPLWSIYQAWQTLPYSGVEQGAPISLTAVARKESGSYQLPLGFFNPPESVWRTIYQAGYSHVPQDIRDATHLYLAEKITRAQNPIGGIMLRNADQMVHLTRFSAVAGEEPPAPLFIEMAERKLGPYRRKASRA